MRFKRIWNVYLRWVERFGVDKHWSLQRELSVRANGQTGMYEWSNSELQQKLVKLEVLWSASQDVGTLVRLQNLKLITKFPRSSRNALSGKKRRKTNSNLPDEHVVRWLYRHEPRKLLYTFVLVLIAMNLGILWAVKSSPFFMEWIVVLLASTFFLLFWIFMQKFGWLLIQDGNTLTYQKFQLLSNWKIRRQGEVILNIRQIKYFRFTTFALVVEMQKQKKKISFPFVGMTYGRKEMLKDRIKEWIQPENP